MTKKISEKYIKVIDQIEKVRKKNNTNWMDILRVAYSFAPKKQLELWLEFTKMIQKLAN